MDTLELLYLKSIENGKVAKALSDKLQTEVDKNSIIEAIEGIDVSGIIIANIKKIVEKTGAKFESETSSMETVTDYSYQNRILLKDLNLPVATSIENYALQYCISLTSLNLPVATSIGNYAMENCKKLKTVKIGVNKVATLSNTNAFVNTPIGNGTGYIYVPDELVDSYKTATNWSVYADQIKPMSECEE